MPRVQPYALPRLVPQGEDLSFDDPRVPGTTLTVRLRALDAPAQLRALGTAERLIAKFVGDPDEGVDPEMEYPETVHGRIDLSSTLIQTACMIEAQQEFVPENGAPYSFDELVALTVTMPTAWIGLMGASGRIQQAFLGKGPKRANPTGTPASKDSSA